MKGFVVVFLLLRTLAVICEQAFRHNLIAFAVGGCKLGHVSVDVDGAV